MIAAPLAAVFLLGAYAQALIAPLALRKDPVARLLGRDFAPIGEVAATLVRAHLADAIVTTDYETTAWLRFTQPGIAVIQINESQRYPDAPPPSPALLGGRLIYLAEFRRDQHQLVQKDFAYTGFPTQMQTPSSLYMLYPIGRPRSSQIGRMPLSPKTKKPRAGVVLREESGHPRRAVEGAGGVPDRTSARVK